MGKKEDEFCQKLMKFVELDWSDPHTHQRSQSNLRKLKWLKGVCTNSEGDIEFQELEKCLSRMMKHWSFYWYHFATYNDGNDTFSFVTSLIDDIRGDKMRVVKVLQAKTMYDLYGKAILAAFAGIKCGLIVTRAEKHAWRIEEVEQERERKIFEKQKSLERARKSLR